MRAPRLQFMTWPDRAWGIRRSRQSRRKWFVRLGRIEALVQI